MEVVWLYTPSPHYNRENFVGIKFFLLFMEYATLRGELKYMDENIFYLLHFHYFISLEKLNTQKSEVFLLRIYSGNVNASVVTG